MNLIPLDLIQTCPMVRLFYFILFYSLCFNTYRQHFTMEIPYRIKWFFWLAKLIYPFFSKWLLFLLFNLFIYNIVPLKWLSASKSSSHQRDLLQNCKNTRFSSITIFQTISKSVNSFNALCNDKSTILLFTACIFVRHITKFSFDLNSIEFV